MMPNASNLAGRSNRIASRRSTPRRYDPVRDFIRDKVGPRGVPSMAVAVFRDGRIDWEEGFGWADREAGVPATADTVYSLASISKPFTATGLMVLAAAGAVDLDGSVNAYLGEAKLRARIGDAREASVRRVANHTSGLPFHVQFFYHDGPYRRLAPAVTIARYGNLVRRPGAGAAYSNLGYGILGEVIARQSGETYADFMRRVVFQPLGLRSTSVGLPAAPEQSVAVRYQADSAPLPYYDTDHPGASEVFASAHDLIAFAAFHLKARLPGQRPILDDAAIEEMHLASSDAGEAAGYGIGFAVGERSGHRVVSHSGGMPGVATQMLLIPSEGAAIVVLCNAMASALVDEVADRIAATLLVDWKPEPDAGVFPPRPQEAFAPTADLAGRWVGHIAVPEGQIPLVLDLPADGMATAAVGAQSAVPVEAADFKDGEFGAQAAAMLETADTARYKHTLYFRLRREEQRLYGGVAALADFTDPRFAAGLSFWTDLKRAPATKGS